MKANFAQLKNARIMLTGATGLIGSVLVKVLAELNAEYRYGMQLLLVARNQEKLAILQEEYKNRIQIDTNASDISILKQIDGAVDYIIHCASVTQSRLMVATPVEVIATNLYGTDNILRLAHIKKVRAVVYLSSMEMYGFSENEESLTEDKVLYLNPLEVRSSYPESKRMCENLCVAYYNEYKVPVKIVRLAQTFGYGVPHDDTRVFAEFGRCVESKRDIVLKTLGNSKRMYLDTTDAANAILTVLICGKAGQAYNAANPKTYCSIKEMAEKVAQHFCGEIQVRVEPQKTEYYSPSHKFNLDISKLESLGWHSYVNLLEIYDNMFSYWREIKG